MILNLEGHTGPVLSVVMSDDDSELVSSSSDGKVRVWSVKAGDSYGQVSQAWPVDKLCACS